MFRRGLLSLLRAKRILEYQTRLVLSTPSVSFALCSCILELRGVFDDSLTHSHSTFDLLSSSEEGYCQVLSWGVLYLMWCDSDVIQISKGD